MYSKVLGREINTEVFEENFKEKNIRFFENFDRTSETETYYVESRGSGYYDLIAVREENSEWNCIPVPVFIEAAYGRKWNDLPEGFIDGMKNIFINNDKFITRDEFDEMIEREKIEQQTEEFFSSFRHDGSRIHQIIKDLTYGEVLVLETAENQYGENIATCSLYIDEDALFRLWQINCWNSSDYGLGTCQCNSHPASYSEHISPETALNYIKEHIEEQEKEEAKKEAERHAIAMMLELAYTSQK
ncbi:MAG: hypothetical protein PHX54_13280 [Lentimicrobiaceae bacterium]|nr:hypothetical protein [Lentimicrobiaceae bacterium]